MNKYLEVLKNVPLFKEMSEQDIESLLICLGSRLVHYDKNETIFYSGNENFSMGIVLSGQVHIIKEDYYGNRHIISSIDTGNIFGETFVFVGAKALPVSILASTDCEIMFVDYQKFVVRCSDACDFHNKLIFNMLEILAQKNLTLNQKIELISKRTTREKLLGYLSNQAQKANNNRFSIPFNRQELADFLSVDRSAMSNELSKLRDEGVLKYNKNKFELFI